MQGGNESCVAVRRDKIVSCMEAPVVVNKFSCTLNIRYWYMVNAGGKKPWLAWVILAQKWIKIRKEECKGGYYRAGTVSDGLPSGLHVLALDLAAQVALTNSTTVCCNPQYSRSTRASKQASKQTQNKTYHLNRCTLQAQPCSTSKDSVIWPRRSKFQFYIISFQFKN